MIPLLPARITLTRRAAVLILVLIACGAGGGSASAPETVTELRLVDPADGSTVTVRPDGPVLHLVCFATWCPPCLDEIRGLADLEARWQDQGYRLVMIGVPTRQSLARLRAFVRDEAPPGRVLFDDTGASLEALGCDDLPAHVLVGPDGRVMLRARRLPDGVSERVEAILGE